MNRYKVFSQIFLNISFSEIKNLDMIFFILLPNYFKSINLIKDFMNFSKIFTKNKNTLQSRCDLLIIEILTKFFPDKIIHLLKLIKNLVFLDPCQNFFEFLVFSRIFFSFFCFEKNLFQKKKLHQNHWIFLSFARIFICYVKREQKIIQEISSFFCLFFYKFCLNPFFFSIRTLEEIKSKLIIFYQKKNLNKIQNYEIKYFSFIGQFFYFEENKFFPFFINFLKVFKKKMNNLKLLKTKKKKIIFSINNNNNQKQIQILDSFIHLNIDYIEKNTREYRINGIISLLKILLIKQFFIEKYIRYYFFSCFCCSDNELQASFLSFFSEIVFQNQVFIQKNLDQIRTIFIENNPIIYHLIFPLYKQFISQEIFKFGYEFFDIIIKNEKKKILNFKTRNDFLLKIFNKTPIFLLNFRMQFFYGILQKNLNEINYKIFAEIFKNVFFSSQFTNFIREKIFLCIKNIRNIEKRGKLIYLLNYFFFSKNELKKIVIYIQESDNQPKDKKNFYDLIKIFLNKKYKIFNKKYLKIIKEITNFKKRK
jgi:hypothetical protein